MTYTSSNIDFEVQSKDNPREKYELRNLNLNYFRSIQPFQHYIGCGKSPWTNEVNKNFEYIYKKNKR